MKISEQDWVHVFLKDSWSGTYNNRVKVNYKPFTPKPGIAETWFDMIGYLIAWGIAGITFWAIVYGLIELFKWGAG